MKNCIQQEAKILTLIAPSGGVVSGSVYKIGELIVVAMISAAEGAKFQGVVEGVFELTKVTLDDVAAGDPLFWDNSAKKLTKTAAANRLVGAAIEAADDAATTVKCRFNGSFGSPMAANVDAIEDGTLSGTANGALESVGATNGGDVSAAINNNFKELQTTVNAILVAMKASGQMVGDA